MIYLDNAATTLVKPPCVTQAVLQALGSFGGVGRGVHAASLAAGRAVFRAREGVAALLGAPSSACVSFALNATMALNIVLLGLVEPGRTVVTTAASHNSVLRPLFRLRDTAGCTVKVVPVRSDGSLDFVAYERALGAGDVALVAATHASNVTGDVYDVRRMAQLAHKAGGLFVLDAAQTAGCYPVSMQDIGADVVCFTGHKSLLGPQGTGGLCVAPGLDVPPLIEGGSGAHSFDERHPRFMPEALEAGTVNAHGLAGLAAACEFILGVGVNAVHAKVAELAARFEAGARAIGGVRIVGGGSPLGRTGIVALQLNGIASSELADALARDFNICTRAGAHCAPLMHEALGTVEAGVVRFSFSYFNTDAEIDQALEALQTLSRR